MACIITLSNTYAALFVFALYILFIVGFAGIYRYIYGNYKNSFAFNRDILKTQRKLLHELRQIERADTKTRFQREKSKLENQLAILNYCLEEIKKTERPVPFESHLLREGIAITPKYRYQVRLDYQESGDRDPSGMPYQDPYTRLLVEDEGGNIVADLARDEHPDRFPTDPTAFGDVIRSFVVDAEFALNALAQRLVTPDPQSQEVWSFLDFLYFSAVTQTTLGYGDILPNSTRVRVCVVLQVFIGLFLIAVALGLVFLRSEPAV